MLLGVHAARMDVTNRDIDQDERLNLNCAWYADVLLTLTARGRRQVVESVTLVRSKRKMPMNARQPVPFSQRLDGHLTSNVCSPPPLITPRSGVTSEKSRPQPSVICSNDGITLLVGIEIDPAAARNE